MLVCKECKCKYLKKHDTRIYSDQAWGNDWDPNLSLEENVERALPAITNFFLVGEDLRLDAFSFEVQGNKIMNKKLPNKLRYAGKEYSSTIEQLGETVRQVLTIISDNDPAGTFSPPI